MTEETLISIELQIISFSDNILAFEEETLSLNDLLENAFSRCIFMKITRWDFSSHQIVCS